MRSYCYRCQVILCYSSFYYLASSNTIFCRQLYVGVQNDNGDMLWEKNDLLEPHCSSPTNVARFVVTQPETIIQKHLCWSARPCTCPFSSKDRIFFYCTCCNEYAIYPKQSIKCKKWERYPFDHKVFPWWWIGVVILAEEMQNMFVYTCMHCTAAVWCAVVSKELFRVNES